MASQIPEKLRAERVARLKQIRDDRFEGSNTLLARAIKKQPDYISRALRGGKMIGEAFAREVESVLDLPARWLDGDAVEAAAEARAFLDAEALGRCVTAVDRWTLSAGAHLTTPRRMELVCTLYEMFFDRPEINEEQMVTFLRRQARVATGQSGDDPAGA